MTDESEFTCYLCNKKIREPRVLPCLHTFCSLCIDDLSSFKPRPKDSQGNKLGLQSVSKTLQGWNNSDSLKSKAKLSHSGSCQNISPVEIWSTPCTPLSSRRNIPQESERLIVCPICKTIVSVPSEGASSLPLNHLLQNKIILSSFKSDAKFLNCDLCSESSTAIYYCTKCADNLCQFCYEAHNRQKKTSSHKVMHIKEIPDDELLSSQQLNCLLHQDKVYSHFCETCQIPICQLCTVSVHKNHDYEEVTIASNLQKNKLSQAMTNIQSYIDMIEITLKKCKSLETSIKDKADSVCAEIDKFYASMIKAIQEHQLDLHQKATNLRDEKMKVLAIQMIQLNHIKKDIHGGIKFAEDLINSGSELIMIDLSVPVIKRLNSLQRVQRKLQPRTDDSIMFNLDEVGTSFFDQKILGKIEGNADLKMNNLLVLQKLDKFEYHHGSVVIGKIIVKNNFQNFSSIVKTLDYRLASQYTERYHTLRMELNSNNDQELLILSSLLPYGKYKLDVKHESIHIQGSPQDINFDGVINSNCEHTGVFHYCTYGSKEGLEVWGVQGQCKGSNISKKHWSCCGSTEERSSCTSLYHVTV